MQQLKLSKHFVRGIEMFRFSAKTEILVTEELTKDILALNTEQKFGTVGILIDNNVRNIPEIQHMLEKLDSVTPTFPQFINSFEPTTKLVDEVTEYYRQKNIGFFIGIGGGSTLDLTKAVSVMTKHPGSVEEYHGTGKPIITSTRKMMIPTTAGTGSEVTPGAVLVNERTEFKRGINSFPPDFAILCPSLTTTMPAHITASTGLDAMGHAIESYTAKNASPITRMYSREAFRLIVNNLNKIFDRPEDLELRKNLLLGANLAGTAIYNSNTGAAHSMAYPTGIYHKVPHGLAVALILPEVIRINTEKGCVAYADLYDVADDRDSSITNPSKKSALFCDMIKDLPAMRYLGKSLHDYGIDTSNSAFLAKRGLDLTPALSNNPVEFDINNANRVLRNIVLKNR